MILLDLLPHHILTFVMSVLWLVVCRLQGEAARSVQFLEDLPGLGQWFLKQQLQRVPDSGGGRGGVPPIPG
jgi:hypothetical protein